MRGYTERVVHRLTIVLLAVLAGAAAPARAWCEASCVVRAHADTSTRSHCPAHESTTGNAISASTTADCPVIESARPTTIARIELKAMVATIQALDFTAAFAVMPMVAAAPQASAVFKRHTPLRI